MDELERAIVNRLQGGFPLAERPFAAVAQELGTDEATLIAKLKDMLAAGTLTRFGPMYDVERMGGAFTLCAMRVPQADFERVASLVNAHPEVAHNYARAHEFNLWFVIAAASRGRIAPLLAAIEAETGYAVLDLPREQEYFIELRLVA
ncbi:MAG: Lrp/AsnC family transcriptional regulator [Betaproteobacteria bacterium]|nr:Lrp/AsnC family transcriptional regulator [Betaproteobacteria bacterium]MDH5221977.1 Lrp/AsnC family transcriptional regulator [Betaproteobacteria bacterium]MDH5350148.1 Lrp/AsnC family transcriptional regulator [Betaproteobacteria bacterium]